MMDHAAGVLMREWHHRWTAFADSLVDLLLICCCVKASDRGPQAPQKEYPLVIAMLLAEVPMFL
jgi:hypothetical protein